MDDTKEIFDEILEEHPSLAKQIADIYTELGSDEFGEFLSQVA